MVVRDALMESIRKVQRATHFKHVAAPSRDDPRVICYDYVTPCSPGDPDAFPMTWVDLPDGNKLLAPPATMRDFLKVLRDVKSSVGPEDLKELEEWTTQFGQEG